MSFRVCYVVNKVSETSVPATIGTALVENAGIEVDILAWFETESFEGEDKLGISCLNAPKTTLGIDRQSYAALERELGTYDLVQAHHTHSGSFAKVAAVRQGVPVVSREGNTRDGFTRKGRIANGLTNRWADRIVCNSPAVYESFTRWERWLVDGDRVTLIPNGVDIARVDEARTDDWDVRAERGIPADSVLIGTAASLTEQKGLDTLVRGFAKADENADHRLDLVIAGDGPLSNDLGGLARSEGIADRVHLLGRIPRRTVYRLFAQLDIYAMPSRWEGFPNAAVEAMAARNACVFSDIDVFTDAYDSVALFHGVDDVNELAEQLLVLAEEPQKRDRLSERGRKLIEEKYTLETVADQYYDLYCEVLGEHGKR